MLIRMARLHMLKRKKKINNVNKINFRIHGSRVSCKGWLVTSLHMIKLTFKVYMVAVYQLQVIGAQFLAILGLSRG
ncbi:hypothetical protein RchiOBHm_Chr5g0061471 [Rosa chinensis]|uniref:Uncharacterized protein n=1 Tax=Rosa chinensis TaxID=74649 RepID=A0A2P6QHY5_ROSCH|nr:hypothetical protein RchiOBHm_Chr5g0061471 [Rosa chinensis]